MREDAFDRCGFRAGVDALAVEAAAEVIGRRRVELPEHLGFPRSQSLGIDGLNVGEGEKGEEGQAFRGADFFREGVNGFAVEDIPAKQRGGHIEMAGDQEANVFPLRLIESQAGKGLLDSVEAAFDVIVKGKTFADVMVEESKQEKLRTLELGKNLGETPLPFVFWVPEPLEIFNGAERVLVHSITVVEIADDERVHGAKLRNEAHQQAKPVHGAQRGGRKRRPENFANGRPQRGGMPISVALRLENLRHLALGLAAQQQILTSKKEEQAEQGSGIAKRGDLTQMAAAAENRVARVREVRSPLREALRERSARRERLIQQTKNQAVEGARVPEINAHPLRGAFAGCGGVADAARGGCGLEFVGEDIVVAAVMKMKKTARGREKIEGGVARRAEFRRRELFERIRGAAEAQQPASGIEITETAGRFFEVGFEMKNGVAVLGMAPDGQMGKRLNEHMAGAAQRPGKGGGLQARKQFGVAV